MKSKAKQLLAEHIIKKMKQRQFEASYVETKEEALKKVTSYFTKGCSITWGGSQSIKEIGLFDFLNTTKDYILLDRDQAKTPQEQKDFFKEAYGADYFLMSSNAITMDGELVNIDGRGNRVSLLCHGPSNVIIVASMNKITKDDKEAIARIKREACPPNTIRLGVNTPCSKTGVCADCLSPECICCQTVITRFSRTPNRIKVILVGEELGF